MSRTPSCWFGHRGFVARTITGRDAVSPLASRRGARSPRRVLPRVVTARPPRQPLRYDLVRDAGLYERVVAGPGPFHRVPLALLTDGVGPVLLPVDGHPVDDPRHDFRLAHAPPWSSFSERKSVL